MTKKVLILSSSYRKGGNSDTLCDQFAKGAAEAGNEVEKIFVNDKNIAYCKGCGVCNTTHKCVIKDDMAEILDKMVSADVIVMDYDPLTPMTADNVNSHLLFGCNGSNVVTTIIDGQVKMENRQLKGIDKEAVLAHCREQAAGLWQRINEGR